MNLCVIYSTNEYLQSDGSLFVVSFSNCMRLLFKRLTYSGLFIFCFEQKISIGQRLKWFKIWNVVFETLALFGPGGDRILLGTDAVSFSNTHCIGDSHGYYFSFVASASQTRKDTDMLQNPIHFRRNIIVVINFSYQLRSNFSRVIRVGSGRISYIVIPHGELAITIDSIEKIARTAAHRI